MSKLAILCVASALALLSIGSAAAQENYERWELLQRTFESTGGGGIMIGEYDPVITGSKCATNFTATEPNGKVHYNIVEWDAVPAQGGTLCKDGKWRARDGSVSGETPLQVFLKDGVRRRSP